MPITRPFGDIEHIFDDILVPVPATVEATMDLPVDVVEAEKKIHVDAFVPGIKPEDITVEIDGKTLVIAGKREEIREKETNEFSSKEVMRGSMYRIVRLPSKVDEARAEAWYDKGILHLVLPKQA